jgi:hypothetical protein
MIGADRRGIITGTEEARKNPQKDMPEEEIRSLARHVLARMREGAYAHLDPEQDFINGFVEGYRQLFLIERITM